MLILGERLTGTQPLAAILFVVSIGIMLRDKHEHFHKHEALEHVHEHSHDDSLPPARPGQSRPSEPA